MKLNSIALIVLISSICLELNSQSQVLEQYIKEAWQQNLNIRSSQLSREKQLSRIDQAKRLWGLSVDLNANYLLATGGRKINFPLGDLFNPVNSTLNELTGANQFPSNLDNLEFQLTPNNFIDVQLNASVPLINSSIRYNQRIQETLLKLEDLNIEFAKEEVELQVKTAYFNYLKSLEGIRILEDSEALLQEVLTFNQKLVKFDKATDEIIYDVQFQIENLKSQKAQLLEQSIAAKSLLNLLLNRALDSDIEVDEELITNLDFDVQSIETLQGLALKNRLEFQQLNIANSVNDLNRIRIQKEALPTLGAQGGIGIQTENFDFDLGGPLYTVGLGMSVSLFDNGLRKKRIEELEVDKNIIDNNTKQLQQQIDIEVIQAYYALASLKSQMESETAAEQSAQRSYDRFKVRYENDKALLIELLQAQNRLTTSQLTKILTQYDFLIKKAELEKIINP